MGYSEEEDSVRVDFFKDSGKWYTTEAVKWVGWSKDNLINDAFRKSLQEHLGNFKPRLSGMIAVCIEPYHEQPFPLMTRIDW